jgi:hypothetical protein
MAAAGSKALLLSLTGEHAVLSTQHVATSNCMLALQDTMQLLGNPACMKPHHLQLCKCHDCYAVQPA